MADDSARCSHFSSVIIVGAGLSGLAMAAKLKRNFNCDNYAIYERSDGLGGTWWENRYPGCAVDVPSVLYSYSFAPNPWFSKPYPLRSEILQYMHGVAEEYDITRHLVQNTEWRAAFWEEESSTWKVEFKDLITNESYCRRCRVLISAVGGLVNPNPFRVPGLDSFQGEVRHTARWEPVNLNGKHVIVVGNGASATQLIPVIAASAKSITQFMRTPQYYVARPPNYHIHPILQRIFYYLPLTLYMLRILIFLYLEISIIATRNTKAGVKAREKRAEISRAYVMKTAPQQYWPLLIPEYDFGCKRLVHDSGYLEALQRSSIDLVQDSIVEVRAQSILTKAGKEYPADSILLATGFSLTHWNIDVRGQQGKSIQEHWRKYGYKEAYKSIAIEGFPNFFYILGPNSVRLHTSAIIGIENFVDLISFVIEPVLENRAAHVRVRPEPETLYNQQLQAALNDTIYVQPCSGWARDPDSARNWAVYPWDSFTMWCATHWTGRGDWIYDV